MVPFGPAEADTYSYKITLNSTQTLGSGTFATCTSTNPGFIHAQGLSLVRDNGKPFHMLGVNAPGWQPFQSFQGHPWKWGDGTFGVDNLYQQMNANGLNWYHMWT